MKYPARLIVLLLLSCIVLALSTGCSNTNSTQPTPGPAGPAGVGITGATVNDQGHLVLSLSDGKSIDAGNVVGPQGPAGLSGAVTGSPASFTSVVPQAELTIVRIDVTLARGLASGSGTIVDKRGYITTNAHVVDGAQSIKVTLKDGTTLAATVVASDTKQDLAIVKMTSNRTDFPTMPLGTMADVVVGEPVMAMGFPAGTNLPGPATFSAGVVSAMRPFDGATYVQTDAPVNPGNSGGCLFTLSGRMIGIPSEGITPANQDFEDINLAIPIDQVRTFIAQNVK